MKIPEIWTIILLHQILFQGIFIYKNLFLRKKLGIEIRGRNVEALAAQVLFAGFIAVALGISLFDITFGQILIVNQDATLTIALILMVLSLGISAASLIHLKDSWRVGVLENQKTELITTGIYSYSRNPYFVSYIIMFVAYTLILQNAILLVFLFVNLAINHKMILKEEAWLQSNHGEKFLAYKQQVPRYLIF